MRPRSAPPSLSCAVLVVSTAVAFFVAGLVTTAWEESSFVVRGSGAAFTEFFYGIGLWRRVSTITRFLSDGTVARTTASVYHEDCKGTIEQCADYYEAGQRVIGLLFTAIVVAIAGVLVHWLCGRRRINLKAAAFLYLVAGVVAVASALVYVNFKPSTYYDDLVEVDDLKLGFSFVLVIVGGMLCVFLFVGLLTYKPKQSQYTEI